MNSRGAPCRQAVAVPLRLALNTAGWLLLCGTGAALAAVVPTRPRPAAAIAAAETILLTLMLIPPVWVLPRNLWTIQGGAGNQHPGQRHDRDDAAREPAPDDQHERRGQDGDDLASPRLMLGRMPVYLGAALRDGLLALSGSPGGGNDTAGSGCYLMTLASPWCRAICPHSSDDRAYIFNHEVYILLGQEQQP